MEGLDISKLGVDSSSLSLTDVVRKGVRAVVYPVLLLSALGFGCGPSRVPSYFDGKQAVLERRLSEEELRRLKRGFDANPEQYARELFDASLARMHQICAPFALEYAEIPELNDGVHTRAEARATWNTSIALEKIVKESGGIPAGFFEEERDKGNAYEIIIEWRGHSAGKAGWEFEIGSSKHADASYMGRVLNVEPVGFEKEDTVYLKDGVLKVRSSASSGDTDGIKATISFPLNGRVLFVLNKTLVPVSLSDLLDQDYVVPSEKYDLPGVVTIKKAYPKGPTPELFAMRDMVRAGKGDKRCSSALRAMLEKYKIYWLIEGDNPFENYRGLVAYVAPILDFFEGTEKDNFEYIMSWLNDPYLVNYYLHANFRGFRGGTIDGYWETAKPTFERKGGHCIAWARTGVYPLKKAGFKTFIRSVDFPGEPCCSDHTGSGIITERGSYLLVVDSAGREVSEHFSVKSLDYQLAHGHKIIGAMWGHKNKPNWEY